MSSFMDIKITSLILLAISVAVTSAGRQLSDDAGVLQLHDNVEDVAAVRRSRRDTPAAKNSLTQDERAQFVQSHNNLRRLVTAANNMAKMVWNGGLESMAQEWANQCNWKHGQPSRSKPPFSYIGQNLYATSGATYSVQNAVQSWYDENADYTYDTMTCAPNKQCGHYMQVAWATSYAVGCGIAYCPKITGTSFGGFYVVCNYGPAGNWVGEKPFTVGGGQCSACSSNMTSCDNGLCTTATPCSLITECTPTDTTQCLCDESYYQNKLHSSAITVQKSIQFSALVTAIICWFCAVFCLGH